MENAEATAAKKGFSGAQVLLFIVAAMVITAGFSFWVFRTYIQPADFKPVELSGKQQVQLDNKLRQLGLDPQDLLPNAKRDNTFDAEGRLAPEKYNEDSEKRDIHLNERELNAMIASNPDLAKRFAIDLSSNLASAKLLIPVDPDMPVMGGKTLRVNAGIELAYRDGQPVVKLRGVSIMGVPIPNAWLGNLKNIDLVKQFGADPGFWKSFSAGVGLIEIVEGQLHIKLKE